MVTSMYRGGSPPEVIQLQGQLRDQSCVAKHTQRKTSITVNALSDLISKMRDNWRSEDMGRGCEVGESDDDEEAEEYKRRADEPWAKTDEDEMASEAQKLALDESDL